MTNELTYEQETVRSVFGAYINDLKVYSSKPDRPMFRRLEEVRDKAIQALEPQRWIPVSERMPEVGEKVLCQCQANIYEVLKLTADGWYHDKNHCYMLGFVIAWMPLPQPYREEDASE
jgi:hypothetical protein